MQSGQLATLSRELEDATKRAIRLGENRTAAELARRAAERWSPAQCVEHLNLTTRAYLPLLDGGIRDLRAKNQLSTGPYRMEWMPRFFAWLLEPPARMKMKTPQPFQPVAVGDGSRVIPDFVNLQKELQQRLEQADGLALGSFRIRSPFAQNVSYNLYSAFVLIAVHERRHLWQAERGLASL